MKLTLKCPLCGSNIAVRENPIGKVVQCPKCYARLKITPDDVVPREPRRLEDSSGRRNATTPRWVWYLSIGGAVAIAAIIIAGVMIHRANVAHWKEQNTLKKDISALLAEAEALDNQGEGAWQAYQKYELALAKCRKLDDAQPFVEKIKAKMRALNLWLPGGRDSGNWRRNAVGVRRKRGGGPKRSGAAGLWKRRGVVASKKRTSRKD